MWRVGVRPDDQMKLAFETTASGTTETRASGAVCAYAGGEMNVESLLAMEKLADALPVERTASRWIVTTDAEEVVERVGAYVKIGFNHLVFHAPGPDQARFLELFGEEIYRLLATSAKLLVHGGGRRLVQGVEQVAM